MKITVTAKMNGNNWTAPAATTKTKTKAAKKEIIFLSCFFSGKYIVNFTFLYYWIYLVGLVFADRTNNSIKTSGKKSELNFIVPPSKYTELNVFLLLVFLVTLFLLFGENKYKFIQFFFLLFLFGTFFNRKNHLARRGRCVNFVILVLFSFARSLLTNFYYYFYFQFSVFFFYFFSAFRKYFYLALFIRLSILNFFFNVFLWKKFNLFSFTVDLLIEMKDSLIIIFFFFSWNVFT